MSYVTNLICRECGAEYKTQPLNVCEFCFGPLEIQYDFTKIKKDVSKKTISNGPNSMWRYSQFLPVDIENAIDILSLIHI